MTNNDKFKGNNHLSYIFKSLEANRTMIERYKPLYNMTFVNNLEKQISSIDRHIRPFASTYLRQNEFVMKLVPQVNDLYLKSLPEFDQITKNFSRVNSALLLYEKFLNNNLNHIQLTDKVLNTSISNYFNSYSNLNQLVNENYKSLPFDYNKISLIQSDEALLTSRLAISLYSEFDEDLKNEVIEIDKIEIDYKNELQSLLDELNPALYSKMWAGAEQAFYGNNIDRIRHTMISLRELLTHVLHILSPTDKVKELFISDEYYDKEGKPTRRTRLLYITRGISQKKTNKYLIKHYDHNLTLFLDFIDLFNKGTHEIESDFKDADLKSFMIKTQLFIIELILHAKISNENKNEG